MGLSELAKQDFRRRCTKMHETNAARVLAATKGTVAGIIPPALVLTHLVILPPVTRNVKETRKFVERPDSALVIALLKLQGYDAELTANGVCFAMKRKAA